VSLPKLEPLRNVTSKVISNRIKARKSKSTEQWSIASLSFALTVRVAHWSNYLTQRADIWLHDQIERLNGQRTLWMICQWYRNRFRHKVGWLHALVSFLLETSKLQSAVNSERKHFCLTLHCCWLHWEKNIISIIFIIIIMIIIIHIIF